MTYDKSKSVPWWAWGSVGVCAAAGCYFALRSEFCSDDFVLLWETRHPFWELIRSYLFAPDVFSDAYYRPLQRLVHLIEFKTFGSIAVMYHSVSIAIHSFNVFLAYRLFHRLGAPARVCTVAALVFAIHPAQVEPVTFISALSGVIATTCLLCALHMLLRFLETGKAKIGWAVVGMSALALLSKEDTISLTITLAVVWWFYSRRRNRLWPVLATVPMIAVWLSWRLMIGGAVDPGGIGFSPNPLTICRNLPFHLSRFVVPVRSVFRLIGFDNYYALRDALSPTPRSELYISAVILVVIVSAVIVWRRWRHWPTYVKAGLGIAISGLLLYLPLSQSATRFLYFPIVGLALAAAGLVLSRPAAWRRTVLLAWVVALALATVEQTSTWYQAGQLVDCVLSEAVRARHEQPPDVGTVFVDYPRRHYAAFVFPIGLDYAIRWQTGADWPHLYTLTTVPADRTALPDSTVWYGWSDGQFVPVEARKP